MPPDHLLSKKNENLVSVWFFKNFNLLIRITDSSILGIWFYYLILGTSCILCLILLPPSTFSANNSGFKCPEGKCLSCIFMNRKMSRHFSKVLFEQILWFPSCNGILDSVSVIKKEDRRYLWLIHYTKLASFLLIVLSQFWKYFLPFSTKWSHCYNVYPYPHKLIHKYTCRWCVLLWKWATF